MDWPTRMRRTKRPCRMKWVVNKDGRKTFEDSISILFG